VRELEGAQALLEAEGAMDDPLVGLKPWRSGPHVPIAGCALAQYSA
jgi:hypothetical protein